MMIPGKIYYRIGSFTGNKIMIRFDGSHSGITRCLRISIDDDVYINSWSVTFSDKYTLAETEDIDLFERYELLLDN